MVWAKAGPKFKRAFGRNLGSAVALTATEPNLDQRRLRHPAGWAAFDPMMRLHGLRAPVTSSAKSRFDPCFGNLLARCVGFGYNLSG